MTTIVVTKDSQGKLVGAGEKHGKAYARFKAWLAGIEPGEIFTLDVWFPRHGKFHRLHFAMLAAVYDAQVVSRDQCQRRFEARYGTEASLLAETKRRVG